MKHQIVSPIARQVLDMIRVTLEQMGQPVPKLDLDRYVDEAKAFGDDVVEIPLISYEKDFVLLLPFKFVKKCEEYRPFGWNAYPDIEPPEHLPMQLEGTIYDEDQSRFRTIRVCARYVSKEWFDAGTGERIELSNDYPIRFKPWE